jgi:uncharacterized protein YjdB
MKNLQKKRLVTIILSVFMLVIVSQANVFAADNENLDSKCILSLKMDEAVGNIVYGSNGTHEGQAVGTTIVDGFNGKARKFDGDDYIKLDNVLIPTGKKTIKFKVKVSSSASKDNDRIIFSNISSSSAEYGMQCYISSTGSIVLNYPTEGGYLKGYAKIGENGTNICDNQWHDVIFTFNGTKETDGVKLYIDAKLDATGKDANIDKQCSQYLTLGNHHWLPNVRYFNGEIDNFEMYNDVIDFRPIGIELNKSTTSLMVDAKEQLSATITPSYAIPSSVEWTSSDISIATVDSKGNITAVKAGKATITAKIKGAELIATCEVTVTDKVDPGNDKAGTLRVEMVDGNIKEYNVTSTEFTNFTNWYIARDRDDTETPIYKFQKNTGKEYLVHDKIVGFEIR